MIRAVTFTNHLGDSIRLDLARPEESGFIIKSVTGLGPGKANINTTEIATNDGSLFNSSRMPSRNIVISLAYMWKDSIEDVRQSFHTSIFLLKRSSQCLSKPIIGRQRLKGMSNQTTQQSSVKTRVRYLNRVSESFLLLCRKRRNQHNHLLWCRGTVRVSFR